jgi:hypothetical protein
MLKDNRVSINYYREVGMSKIKGRKLTRSGEALRCPRCKSAWVQSRKKGQERWCRRCGFEWKAGPDGTVRPLARGKL